MENILDVQSLQALEKLCFEDLYSYYKITVVIFWGMLISKMFYGKDIEKIIFFTKWEFLKTFSIFNHDFRITSQTSCSSLCV